MHSCCRSPETLLLLLWCCDKNDRWPFCCVFHPFWLIFTNDGSDHRIVTSSKLLSCMLGSFNVADSMPNRFVCYLENKNWTPFTTHVVLSLVLHEGWVLFANTGARVRWLGPFLSQCNVILLQKSWSASHCCVMDILQSVFCPFCLICTNDQITGQLVKCFCLYWKALMLLILS